MKVTIDQEEIMKLIAERISEKLSHTKEMSWEDVVFEIVDVDGNVITYEKVEAYIENIY
jgi:hypothetical protein